MGGYGSGRWWRYGTRRTTVQVEYALDVRYYQRLGVFKPGMREINLSWCEVPTVPVSQSACHFGGVRFWFHCPACGTRVALLYSVRAFLRCRTCHNLAYPSQNVSAHDRPLRRAQAIRMRLGGTGNMLEPFPVKPRGMHWDTYSRLWQKYCPAERRDLAGMQAWLERMRGCRA
jgi:hypothetical protein